MIVGGEADGSYWVSDGPLLKLPDCDWVYVFEVARRDVVPQVSDDGQSWLGRWVIRT